MLEACTKTKTETVYVDKYVPLECEAGPVPYPTFEVYNVEEGCPVGYVCYQVMDFKLFVTWVVELVTWAEEMDACARKSDSLEMV